MRKIFFLIVLLAGCMKAAAVVNSRIIISKEMALQTAKEAVGEGDYDYYIGETYWTFTPVSPKDVPVPSKAWLVFVDEEPNSGWEHPCKYVYVKKTEELLVFNPRCAVIDAVCPPIDVKLEPLETKNRYGDAARMKPFVPKTNAPNPAAGNTYAVILDGGMSVTSHNERYWNDCSFLYQTLRNTYEVPKQNIKVIMSDGTSEEADLNTFESTFESSPLDLDGDGYPDIEYSATRANLKTVLAELGSKLTDDDHLLLFVTDHGGYDHTKNSSFIYMWNNERLYPEELASYLEPVDAGFVTIVMGQCYSGGFIDKLQKTNRVIITACGEDEKSYSSTTVPFNEFLYHWTSAINGADALGKNVCTKSGISVIDAQAYAAVSDVYANNEAKFGSETPQLNYFTHSVVYDLSLSNIPPVVDLCFDKYKNPSVSVQKTTSYRAIKDFFSARHDFIKSYFGIDTRFSNNYFFWSNPYIWIRNQADGFEVHTTEKPIIEKEKDVYVYVKVRNKGVKTYDKSNVEVRTFWTESSIVPTEAQWKGYSTLNNSQGGEFCTDDVEDVLAPGASTIVELNKAFSGKSLKALQKDSAELCLLAYLRPSDSNVGFLVDSNAIAATWLTDKLGQSNVYHLHRNMLTTDRVSDSLRIQVVNSGNGLGKWGLYLMDSDRLNSLFTEARVSLRLSPNLMTSWNNGGQESEDIEIDKNEQNRFLLTGTASKLHSLKMEPYQAGKMGLQCNFLAENGISERKEYDVDFAMIDEETGQCLGGETFRIIQDPRAAINPTIASVQTNGMTMLKAENLKEDVLYKWYDADGTLVGTGETFAVPAGKPQTAYQLKVEAKTDGAISYSEFVQAESSMIRSVDSQSNSSLVRVLLEGPAGERSTLRLASATGNAPVTEYAVESGATECYIPAEGLSSGVYQVSLMENGTLTGVKKFMK